jgi:hypothetical protein
LSEPLYRWLALALVGWVVLIMLAQSTLTGRWRLSFLGGSRVRWRDAYVALDSAELNLPRDSAQRERLLVANAQVESEPPLGLLGLPRIHPRGTLTTLRYERLDENNRMMDSWVLRALLPALPSWTEVGKRFELSPTPIHIQDILDSRQRELTTTSVQVRVAGLRETCAAPRCVMSVLLWFALTLAVSQR